MTTDDRVATWMQEIRVLDGGFGTECQKRSPLPIDGHKAWSCRLLKEDPNLVCDIHRSFLRAGSDVLSTNTYQAAPHTLAEAMGIGVVEAKELMRHAVRLVRRAIKAETEAPAPFNRKLPILVAGSLGPYGACKADGSEYTGDYLDKVTYEDLVDFHLARATILLDAGVDLIAWETIPALVEAASICEVMRRVPGALGWLSIASSNGQTTVSGDPLYFIAAELNKCPQLFGIGVNCNIEHDRIGLALANLGSQSDPCGPGTEDGYHPPPCSVRSEKHHEHGQPPKKLLIMYANSGEVYIPSPGRADKFRDHWMWPSGKGPSEWAKHISKWVACRPFDQNGTLPDQTPNETSIRLGHPLAQWAGGCCRVGPEQIRMLAQLMKPDEFSRLLEPAVAAPSSPPTTIVQTETERDQSHTSVQQRKRTISDKVTAVGRKQSKRATTKRVKM